MRAALQLPVPTHLDLIPSGIYTVPEISCVGESEAEAKQKHGDILVGRARFAELARGQIAGTQDGLLKLIVAPDSLRILGCQIIGEGATELVHLAQMAMMTNSDVGLFVDKIFNFPTLAEAYRVAALDVMEQVTERARAIAAAR
jgi:NAD(P) transhydrogenase